MRFLKLMALVFLVLVAGVSAYGAKGYWDALSDADALRVRADELIAQNRGGSSLGPDHLKILLTVEDPNFAEHIGVDFFTAGAGATTITQSASKRLAFKQFRPGIRKIRQTGYALGLERRLTKDQILALWLDTVEMGEGPDGWMTGFHDASSRIYARPPSALSKSEFVRLVAVLISPASYDLVKGNAALLERSSRIERLVDGECAPSDHGDVWLEGCQRPPTS